MACRHANLICLLFVTGTAGFGVLAHAHTPENGSTLILSREEGEVVGSHRIKADRQTGSTRIGVGLQLLKAGQGISIHMHEREDEVLFIHSGSGFGVVGDERKSIGPGTTIYIPQGSWHAIESHSDMEVLWLVSPPHFADNLRAIGAKYSTNGRVSSHELDEIARRHGFHNSAEFFVPRLGIIAAALAIAGSLVGFFVQTHRFRAAATYGLGAILGTIATIFAFGPGQLPPVVFGVAILLIIAAVVIGILVGLLGRRMARPVSA